MSQSSWYRSQTTRMPQRCIDISIRYRQIRQSVRFVLVFFSNQNIHIFIFVTQRLRSQDFAVIRFRSIECISEGDAQIKQSNLCSAAKNTHSLIHAHTLSQHSECKNASIVSWEKKRNYTILRWKIIKWFSTLSNFRCFSFCYIRKLKGRVRDHNFKKISMYISSCFLPPAKSCQLGSNPLTLAVNDALCILKMYTVLTVIVK